MAIISQIKCKFSLFFYIINIKYIYQENIIKKLLIISISLIIHQNILASFSVEHRSCIVRVKDYTKDSSKEYLGKTLSDLLSKKGYKQKKMFDNKRLFPKEMYITLEVKFGSEIPYKSCTIKVLFKEAKRNYPSSMDKLLINKESKRRLPRITFKGKERCSRALKDAFIHIPNCKISNQ